MSAYSDFASVPVDITRRVASSVVSMLPFTESVMTPDSATQKAAMTSSDTVEVFRVRRAMLFTRFIGFKPLNNGTKKNVGFIIYPGANVDAECYAPIARSMADLGYYAAVASPPLNFMITDKDLAQDILNHDQFKDVETWAISGHSLGGVIACHFVKSLDIAQKIKGLALLASYPDDGTTDRGVTELTSDLSNHDIKVTSIYGTVDGLTTLEAIENSKKSLPADSKFVAIEGGNHTQFYYSKKLQKGDNEASITRDEQQEQIRKAVLELLVSL